MFQSVLEKTFKKSDVRPDLGRLFKEIDYYVINKHFSLTLCLESKEFQTYRVVKNLKIASGKKV